MVLGEIILVVGALICGAIVVGTIIWTIIKLRALDKE